MKDGVRRPAPIQARLAHDVGHQGIVRLAETDEGTQIVDVAQVAQGLHDLWHGGAYLGG